MSQIISYDVMLSEETDDSPQEYKQIEFKQLSDEPQIKYVYDNGKYQVLIELGKSIDSLQLLKKQISHPLIHLGLYHMKYYNFNYPKMIVKAEYLYVTSERFEILVYCRFKENLIRDFDFYGRISSIQYKQNSLIVAVLKEGKKIFFYLINSQLQKEIYKILDSSLDFNYYTLANREDHHLGFFMTHFNKIQLISNQTFKPLCGINKLQCNQFCSDKDYYLMSNIWIYENRNYSQTMAQLLNGKIIRNIRQPTFINCISSLEIFKTFLLISTISEQSYLNIYDLFKGCYLVVRIKLSQGNLIYPLAIQGNSIMMSNNRRYRIDKQYIKK